MAARPGRYSGSSRDLVDALAKKHGVKPENIVLGCGSTQILRSVTHLYTAKDKPLVATIPTYEECAEYATLMGNKVIGVPLNSEFKPDLDRFADASQGRGARLLLQSEQPVVDLRRREGDARLHQEAARASRRTRRSSSTRRTSSTSPIPITRRSFRSRSAIRASSSRARSRRRMAWRACASATRSATPTRSRSC